MDWDFAGMSHRELAADTLRRAQDHWALSDAAFEAVGPAVLASIPFALAGSAAFVGAVSDWEFIPWYVAAVLLVLSVAIAYPFVARWNRRIAACRRYTAEMKTRREELERRNAATSLTTVAEMRHRNSA